MLRFDMAGRMIAPGRLKKTLGGDFDAFGIPTGFEIPTSGDYDGVTVANHSDPHFGKTLSRTSAGLACARGPELSSSDETVAFVARSRVAGGGSNSSSGATDRSFRVGFLSDDGQSGAFVEYRDPNTSSPGTYFTTLNGSGGARRQPVNLQINNPSARYALELWVTKDPHSASWEATICEGDRPRHAGIGIPSYSINMSSVRPIVQWDWTDASGYFSAAVCQLAADVYWRF